jgi:type 1 fimbriae regulatory protein FimB/type 1 fimbriae regulatory protein FimE
MLSDWDAGNASLWVTRKKGSESGRFFLLPVEGTAVRAWIKKRGIVAGPLFPSRKHSPISRDQVHHLMHLYCAQAGIPAASAHPHALKHSCGTHVLARVKDLSVVQKWLGHRSIQSTEVYAKVLGQALQDATAQLRDWR